MRLLQTIGSIPARLVASAIVGVFVTFGLFLTQNLPGTRWSSAPAELARQRLDDEQHVAEELGFELDRVVPLTTDASDVPIELHADECLALIATTWGPFRPRNLIVIPTRREDVRMYDDDIVGSHLEVDGLVAHAQLCPLEDAHGSASVWAQHIDYQDDRAFERGELRILRAPLSRIGSPERLNRGWSRRALQDARDAGADASAGP